MDQFRQQPQQSVPQQQSLASKLNSIKSMAGGDASGFLLYLSKTNPQFSDFAHRMVGKTPEQAFAEFGLDYSRFRGIL